MTTFDVTTIHRLIKTGTPVHGVYCQGGAWVQGRVQRVRRQSAIAWMVQPWGCDMWKELKSYRHLWVVERHANTSET